MRHVFLNIRSEKTVFRRILTARATEKGAKTVFLKNKWDFI